MTNKPIDISVIVPVYNTEKLLPRCIDSILAQSFTNFELIIIDDGSTDGSGTICDEYAAKDSRVKVIHKANGGVSSARNAGLDIATGKWITFADADDYVNTEWLKSFMENTSDTDIVIQGIKFIPIDGNTSSDRIITTIISPDIPFLISQLLSCGIMGYLFNKIFKLKLIKQNRIKFNTDIHFREDEIFVTKYLEFTKSYICIEKINYYYSSPSEKKTYKGSITEATPHICTSIISICQNKIPEVIKNKLRWSVKGYVIEKLLNNHRLSSHDIQIYRTFIINSGSPKNFSDQILNCVIYFSPLLGKISNKIIQLIHHYSSPNNKKWQYQ